MHEQSLVESLLRQVDAIRSEQHAQFVTEVRVEIGALSGVEPLLLASAFRHLVPDSSSAGAKLVIDEVSVLAKCAPCCVTFEVSDFVFRCPHCGGNVNLIRGDAVQLVSVSLGCDNETPELIS